jgi:hypothetical protein
MTIESFIADPWRKSHATYKASGLAVSPAPEYASSEVILASLYRVIGYESVREGDVPAAGRKLEAKMHRMRDRRLPPPPGATLGVDAWNTVLQGVLESPKLPNQSTKRFLQVTPLIPAVATFSGSARLGPNPWTPGSLVRSMVWLGSSSHEEALKLWTALFTALSVDDKDDVFARWLEQEAATWEVQAGWNMVQVKKDDVATLSAGDFQHAQFMPAKQFTKDLGAIISAKESMTRRQWTSLLESILRLATVAHVTWLCDVQARIWECLSNVLLGQEAPGADATRLAMFPTTAKYMYYGGKALDGLKDRTSRYLRARLATNTVLWTLDKIGAPYKESIGSSGGVAQLCKHITSNLAALSAAGIANMLEELWEREGRALGCKKGIGANMLEFARHSLGQRQTAVQLLRGYDQGYVLRKKSSTPSSPWVVSLGPVSVLALVHCSLAGMGGPRSIHQLGLHLAAYGIAVDRQDIARNDLGQQLRMLGLVLDSPDAESGMLLLQPFPSTHPSSNSK